MSNLLNGGAVQNRLRGASLTPLGFPAPSPYRQLVQVVSSLKGTPVMVLM